MPTSKAKKPFTEEEKTKHIKKIREEVEKQKKKVKKGENFMTPTDEQLKEKLGRVNSPVIIWEAWGSAPPGGTFAYSVGVHNPDPVMRNGLVCYFFVGPGNPLSDLAAFMLDADASFPKLAQTPPFGFSLNPGETKTISFNVRVPSSAVPSGYIGNSVLFEANFFDVGTFLDRATFVFEVT